MKRLTAIFRAGVNWPGPEALRAAIDREFSSMSQTWAALSVTQHGKDHVKAQFRSERSPKDLQSTFEGIATALDLRFVSIGWGWLSLQDSLDKQSTEVDPDDQYSNLQAQVAEAQIYKYGLGNALTASFLIAGLIGGITLAIWSVTAGPLPLIVSSVWASIAFAYGLVHQVTSIRCDGIGLEVKYLVRGAKRLHWEDITSLRIARIRIQWCYVRGGKARLSFALAPYYGLRQGPMLIRTILQRAELLLVESSPWGTAEYRRFDPTSH